MLRKEKHSITNHFPRRYDKRPQQVSKTHGNDDPTDGNPTFADNAEGLRGNPASTGEIFSDDASNFRTLHGDETALRTIGNVMVQDTASQLRISAHADGNEITDNIRTGRVLANGGEDVAIRPHFTIPRDGIGGKNPEFNVNGEVADAKRVASEKGITAGVRKAIEQGCHVVIIDFDSNRVNPRDCAIRIARRMSDFSSNKITDCYVVHDGKYVRIRGADIAELAYDNAVATIINKLAAL